MALSYYLSILSCAAVITLIGLDSCECAAAAGQADQQRNQQALEQLFRAIDADRDGIIKMNELENLQQNQEFRNLVRDENSRARLIELLKNACGINIETFKALFNQHFQRPAVPQPPANNQDPGVLQAIGRAINTLVGDAISATVRVAAQARPPL
ncbi:uncharacterized protein LOC111056857 [Nilaparvata lugens]|uniref:uncharacterized protein LOC111056857 n=1 Tax=Nilaparvata lugens TaxID=108931 RepID=UPI00193E2F71|nr:uncharacterized protein LOC111056857 [Nilaparvata lugens]